MNPLRDLPSVEKVAADPLLAHLSHPLAIRSARRAIDEARALLLAGNGNGTGSNIPITAPTPELLAHRAAELARDDSQMTLRPAINATGILLHTNLGRATLADAAARAVAEVATGHSSLEIDDEGGGRGSRQAHVRDLLCALTGAEDALVVNNNAAATILAVAALAAGREVILSRGEMVEIGGHFRLPDVIASAGAHLVEVGTTNRTRIADFAAALTDRTAMLLRVHPSNYKIIGFTEAASLPELVALGRQANVRVADDIGSGAVVDFAPFGLTDAPMAQVSLRAGADMVWFSGDKLLGGPQAGILVGTAASIAPMKNHPLARSLRPDKLTLAALEATLRIYQSGNPWDDIPILRRIARSAADVRLACQRLEKLLQPLSAHLTIRIVETMSEVGGGSLPGGTLPSFAVSVQPLHLSTEALARRLRKLPHPVYGRTQQNHLLLDLRAVALDEETAIATALAAVLA